MTPHTTFCAQHGMNHNRGVHAAAGPSLTVDHWASSILHNYGLFHGPSKRGGGDSDPPPLRRKPVLLHVRTRGDQHKSAGRRWPGTGLQDHRYLSVTKGATRRQHAGGTPKSKQQPCGALLPPPCDIPSGCCSFTGPWTVTRSSLRMLRRVAAFCRRLRPVLLLVSFPRSRSPAHQ